MATPSWAQAVPPASQISPPTREELNPVPQSATPDRPRLSISGDIERAPCPLADPKFAGITVSVNEVTFNNLKGLTPEEMRAAWAPYAGTQQPVAVLCDIRDAAATMLRARGYLAAVQVPTQRIENGQIRMEVLYARIVAIRARGETSGAEARIAGYLGRLAKDEIFDRNRAERYLLLARDLPGYNVQLTLKPAGTGPGELVGEVTVLHRAYAIDMTVQNLASEAVGRWGAQVREQFFGLTGMGDATTLSFYSTLDFEEQQIVQVGHEFRLGNDGLKIAGQFTSAWTQPALPSGGNLVAARTLFGTVEAEYPLLRRQSRNLYVGGGIDIVDQLVDFNKAAVARDRLRVAFARVRGDAIDLEHALPHWQLSGNLELRHGVDILNGAPTPLILRSRPDGDPEATLIRGGGVAQLALGPKFSISFAPRFQFAFNPVFAFDEYSAGNYSIGRGFDPGVITGDNGVGASVELHGPAIDLGKARNLILRPYVYTDAVRIWDLNVGARDGGSRHRGLVSMGGGIRAALSDWLRLETMVTVPVDVPLVNGVRADRNVHFWVSLTTRLLPWSAR